MLVGQAGRGNKFRLPYGFEQNKLFHINDGRPGALIVRFLCRQRQGGG
jgi:hypothetical protein